VTSVVFLTVAICTRALNFVFQKVNLKSLGLKIISQWLMAEESIYRWLRAQSVNFTDTELTALPCISLVLDICGPLHLDW